MQTWECRRSDELPRSKRMLLMHSIMHSSIANTSYEKAIWDICDDYLFGKDKAQWAEKEKYNPEGTPFSEDSDWD